MIRTIGGVAAGLIVALLLLFGVEAGVQGLFPVPGSVEGAERLAAGLALLVLAGWTLGTFAGALLADRIGGRGLAGYIVAALVAAAGAWTMAEVAHPLWMQVSGVLLPFAAAFAAERLERRRF